MTKAAPTDSPERKLSSFRARIDALDDKLIKLFVERMGIVKEVAALKAKHWPNACHIRSGREGEMHRRIAEAFMGTVFPARAAVTIWRHLIGASTTVESPLHIAYLASEPGHFWLAREYFGPLINLTSVASPSLVESSNVLVLPAPDEPGVNWWRNPILHKGKPLMLFAKLPLVEEELPGEMSPAVALAPITPEASGDDVSYFLLKTGSTQAPSLKGIRVISHGSDHLFIIDGFVSPEDAAIRALRKQLEGDILALHWLGVHPRPFTLGDFA